MVKWNESCWKGTVYIIFSATAFLVTFREKYFMDPYHYWTGKTQQHSTAHGSTEQCSTMQGTTMQFSLVQYIAVYKGRCNKGQSTTVQQLRPLYYQHFQAKQGVHGSHVLVLWVTQCRGGGRRPPHT
jgi:hypothetical protein